MTCKFESLTVNLSNATTTLNSNTDVEVSESFSTKKKDGFNGLHLKTFGLHDINGLAIELHNTLTSSAVSNGNGSFLNRERDGQIAEKQPKIQFLTLRPKAWTEGLACSEDISKAHFLSRQTMEEWTGGGKSAKPGFLYAFS